MEYQLMHGDSVIVLCEKCKFISFDHKVCMHCHYQFPETAIVKLLKRNKQVIEVTGWNIKPMPPETFEFEEEILSELTLNEKHHESRNEQHELKSRNLLHELKSKNELHELKSKNEQQKAKSNSDKKGNSFYRLLKDVKTHDIDTLKEGEYLNDKIIDVYLEYIYHKQILPDVQARTHIFSTHFFSTLKLKWEAAKEKPEINSEKLEQWVSTNCWTNKVDLFSKDFIIIPIHTEHKNIHTEHKEKHWFLIVLCYLPKFLKGHCTYEKEQSSELPEADSAEKVSCLYFFDSLDNGNSFNEEKRTFAVIITKFLEMLWNKKDTGVSYNWNELVLCKTKCPQQTNGYDCGVYLLQYVENIFKISISPSLDLSRWFSQEEMKNKRTEIKNIIIKLIETELPRNTSHCSSDSDVAV